MFVSSVAKSTVEFSSAEASIEPKPAPPAVP
jgi:hypothetical protein